MVSHDNLIFEAACAIGKLPCCHYNRNSLSYLLQVITSQLSARILENKSVFCRTCPYLTSQA